MKKYKNYRLSEKPGFDFERIEHIREVLKLYNVTHPESFLESHFRFRIYDPVKTGSETKNSATGKTPAFKLLFLMDNVPRLLIFAVASQIPNLTPISHLDE